MSNLAKTIDNSQSLGTSGAALTISSDVSFKGAITALGNSVMGTITSAGLLTASNGLTVTTGTVSLPAGSVATAALAGTFMDLTTTQTITGQKIFSGLSTTSQSYDTVITSIPFAASLSFAITAGMVYMLPSTSAATALAFTAIPTTTNQSYVFTLIFIPSAANTAFYFTGSTITVNGIVTALKGSVTLPVTYTCIIQTITIIATSPTNFFALNSVQGY